MELSFVRNKRKYLHYNFQKRPSAIFSLKILINFYSGLALSPPFMSTSPLNSMDKRALGGVKYTYSDKAEVKAGVGVC